MRRAYLDELPVAASSGSRERFEEVREKSVIVGGCQSFAGFMTA
jgi:hypothetical protein